MNTTLATRSASAWGRYAVYSLVRTFNCPGAVLLTCEHMLRMREDALLAAAPGLVGGVAGMGSSCGLVSGGALGIALACDCHLEASDSAAEYHLVQLSRDYVEWFEHAYGSTRCDDNTHVDFGTPIGLLTYVLPGHRMIRCMSHAYTSAKYLQTAIANCQPALPAQPDQTDPRLYCARTVLQRVRSATGVGDPVLERVSVVLDGGIGLTGGACGALMAAVLAVNLAMGRSLTSMTMPSAYAGFLTGLARIWSRRAHKPDHGLAAGNHLAHEFEARQGSIECRELTGIKFADWDSFQEHLRSSDKCHSLVDFAANEATRLIASYQSSAPQGTRAA